MRLSSHFFYLKASSHAALDLLGVLVWQVRSPFNVHLGWSYPISHWDRTSVLGPLLRKYQKAKQQTFLHFTISNLHPSTNFLQGPMNFGRTRSGPMSCWHQQNMSYIFSHLIKGTFLKPSPYAAVYLELRAVQRDAHMRHTEVNQGVDAIY